MTKVFTIYDSKAECYLRPLFARSTGEAIRSFTDEVNSGNEQSQIAIHPEDFNLFELGEWDELTGMMTLHEAKKSLGCGIDFKRTPEPQLRAAK